MASGHANRANRPNTWLHRPATQREVLTCQPGAVHTWHLSEVELAGIAVSLTPGLPRIWVTQSNRARAPCGWQASRRDRETLLASLGHRDPLLPSGTW